MLIFPSPGIKEWSISWKEGKNKTIGINSKHCIHGVMPNIRIKKKTQERLKFFGKFGMSYDDVINDALDQLEDAIEDELEEEEEEE